MPRFKLAIGKQKHREGQLHEPGVRAQEVNSVLAEATERETHELGDLREEHRGREREEACPQETR